MFRLFFNRNSLALGVEFNDTEALRIIYIVTENSSAVSGFCIFYGSFQTFLQSVSCENIVSEHHGNGIVTDEIRSDDKCLGKSVRAWLYCVGQLDSELASVL